VIGEGRREADEVGGRFRAGHLDARRGLAKASEVKHTILALGLALLGACAGRPPLLPAPGFGGTLGSTHPLTGKIWSIAEHRFVRTEELLDHVTKTPRLLLGESHDNPDHHLLEARLLDAFVTAQPKAAVAFEMLDETQAGVLSEAIPNADELARRVGWAESGWPDFALYRPVFETLLAHHTPILAAHPSRTHVMEVMHGQGDALLAALPLTPKLPDSATQALATEIRESHCGYAPEAMLEPMLRAQSYKDASMAMRLVTQGTPVALVAGRGHVLKDRAVPLYVARLAQGPLLSVAFLEVSDAATDPCAYDVSGFDYVIFTPRASDENACDKFRAQLESMRSSASKPAR
jgi:uncharacterized iron-regulated protein